MRMSRGRRGRNDRGYKATLIAPEGGANRVVAVVAGAKRRKKINMRPLSTRPLGGRRPTSGLEGREERGCECSECSEVEV